MNKKNNKLLVLLLPLLALTACDRGGNSASNSVTPSTDDSVSASETPSASSDTSEAPVGPETFLDLDDYKAYVAADLQQVVTTIFLTGGLSDDLKADVTAALNAGKAAIQGANDVLAVKAAFKAAKSNIANCIPLANGIYDYSQDGNAVKMDILGVLETYAVKNGITGISLFENGGYVMYNDRVVLGTEKYIIGYGFGTLADGYIKSPLANEENADWAYYYHTLNANDPGTENYLNNQGSEVGDFYGYDHGGYFTTFMNDTKDGYFWTTELANTLPEKANESGTAWRFEVKVGDEVRYNTNSKIPSRAEYNNRGVELEDYVTPFKLLLNAKNNLYRGSDLANTSSGAIKGAKAYYEATNGAATAEAAAQIPFDTVGVKAYTENGKNYFEIEFEQPQTQFNCMYQTASSLYQPIPQSFLDLVTVENYLGFNADKSESPVDNALSLGAYTLERWDSEQQVIYKKNPNYVHAATKYQIPGVKIKIHTAMNTDTEAGFREFLAGNTDSTGIPQTQLSEYRTDPRTRQTTGDANFKLNVNATDKETWEYLFGEDGVICSTPKSQYWDVKPAMGNEHFVKGLSYAINRNEFADARGSVGSVNFFAPNYMASQETKKVEGKEALEVTQQAYNDLDAHKNAVAQLLEGTTNGYSADLAKDYFKMALDELVAEGAYVPGTAADPTVIKIEIAWMYPTHENAYHKEIKQYLEAAFNDPEVSDGKFKLEVEFWVGETWDAVYNDKLMCGQYDLGFGAISGNTLDPLGFFEVLSSTPAINGNFCLNWGTDTNDPDADIIVYNGMRWSFDALLTAGNQGAAVKNGANVPLYTLGVASNTLEDGTWTTVVEYAPGVDAVSVDAFEAVIFSRAFDFDHFLVGEGEDAYYDFPESWVASDWFYASLSSSYLEIDVESIGGTCTITKDETTGVVTLTITVPADVAVYFHDVAGFDIYGSLAINGNPAVDNGYVSSVYCSFEVDDEE